MPLSGKGVYERRVRVIELVVVVGLEPVDWFMRRVALGHGAVARTLAAKCHMAVGGHCFGAPRY